MTSAADLRDRLRALDARRADAYADHMRPDGARETTMTMGDQAYRVVIGGVTVRDVTLTRTNYGWRAAVSSGARYHDRTAHAAVACLAADLRWEITEIRGPGESTTAEQLAAATARAEAAEQENARLRAALREHARECGVASCARFATWSWRVSGVDYHTCDEHRGESSFMEEVEHADVLRSLDGVTR